MELQVLNSDGQTVEPRLTVADAIFARDFNETLVHQVVTTYLAGARAGTKAQKSRSTVSGGGAKPWRQKGTGRARAGTIRSPLWRSGGVTFAASPRDHSRKINKKMYRAAMRSIFSELLRQERLRILDSLSVSEPKTKAMVALLAKLDLTTGKVLFVTEEVDSNLFLSARNLRDVEVSDVAGLNPCSLVQYNTIVVTKNACERIGEWLS